MIRFYARFCHAVLAMAYAALLAGAPHHVVAAIALAGYVALVLEPEERRLG
jgi:hypothetical protein